MNKIWEWLFGAKKKERSYWTVALQGRYTDVGVVLESYVSSHLFETWEDAAKFAVRLQEKFSKSAKIMGVVEVRTSLPLTVVDIDYDVTDEYGNHQVTYRWLDGVDNSAQEKAEQQANEMREKAIESAKRARSEYEAKQAGRKPDAMPKRRGRKPKLTVRG